MSPVAARLSFVSIPDSVLHNAMRVTTQTIARVSEPKHACDGVSDDMESGMLLDMLAEPDAAAMMGEGKDETEGKRGA